MVDEDVAARHLELELDDRGAAGRHGGRSGRSSTGGRPAAPVYTRSKISPMTWNDEVALGPPTPKKMRTVSPTLAFIGCSVVSAPTAPLKTKYSARSAEQLLHAELVVTALPEGPVGVELALHDVELVVHLGQPARRLDEDQPVHPARDVVRHHRRGAVVDVEPRVERLEAEGFVSPGGVWVMTAPPPGPVDRVEVDGVDHPAVRRGS